MNFSKLLLVLLFISPCIWGSQDSERDLFQLEQRVFDAARKGNLSEIENFFKRPEPMKIKDRKGQLIASGLLTYAAGWGQLEVLNFLLKHGIDINSSYHGRTAAHWAADQGKGDVLLKLIKNGVDLNKTTSEGETPLMTAASQNRLDIIKMLIENKAKLDSQDKRSGRTALMRAAAHADIEIVKTLLNAGANKNKKDNWGDTAQFYAYRRASVVELLESNGLESYKFDFVNIRSTKEKISHVSGSRRSRVIDLPENLIKLIAQDFSEFRLPQSTDYIDDWWLVLKYPFDYSAFEVPFFISGDFNSDGQHDIGLILINKKKTENAKVILFNGSASGAFKPYPIEAWSKRPPQSYFLQVEKGGSVYLGTFETHGMLYKWKDKAYLGESDEPTE